MSKKVKIIFTLSFLLNLVLFGVLFGGMYKMHHWRDSMSMNMSEHTRVVFKENMSVNREAMRDDFQKMKQYKDELEVIISAESFDAAAYALKMSQIKEIKDNIFERKQATLQNTLSNLSQQEREDFSGHVMRMVSDGKKHGDHKPMKNKEFDKDSHD